MNIKDHAKNEVLMIVAELKTFLSFILEFFTEKFKNHIHKMTYIFLKQCIIPMITANSTVKSISQGTARPKWVWHPQCATQADLASTLNDSSRSGIPSARPKSV